MFETVLFPNILMVAVIVLVGAMVVVISQLYKNFVAPEYCLELIMRFFHDELVTLKQEAKGAKETATLLLIGVVEYFGKKHMLSKQQRQVLAIKVLKSNLDLSAKELSRYYAKAASYQRNEKQFGMVLRGAQVAKQWLNFHSAKNKLSASKRLNVPEVMAS